MLWFKNLFLPFSKKHFQKATLIYKLKSYFISTLFLQRAKQLRAHGKPWMQRVPYTFPLYKLPPRLSFYLKGFSCSFSLSDSLDKIKVGGDSCLPHISIKSVHRITKIKT